jgi:hypothetical protein
MRLTYCAALLLAVHFGAAAEGIRIVPLERGGSESAVRVEDEAGRPVAGASVSFELPKKGPGGSFQKAGRHLTVQTNAEGIAVAPGFQPNKKPGAFTVRVEATHQGQTQTASLALTNAPTVITTRQRNKAMTAAIIALTVGAASLIGALLSL